MIPILDLQAQYKNLAKPLNKAMASGQYVLGPQVKQFEAEMAALATATRAPLAVGGI